MTLTNIENAGTPAGFGELERDRDVLVDVYFGERRVGEALATLKQGRLLFKDPFAVLGLVRSATRTSELEAALSQPLALNADRVCPLAERPGACGTLSPPIAAIIFDEQRFRADLFINPRFLQTTRAQPSGFLPVADAPLSLTSAVGLAAAGALGSKTSYNLQNRTIIALGNARLRTSSAVASGLGWVVDDFVAEMDRREMRYSAGLFWTPGDEFTGQRRILGAGFGTQLDTAIDREALAGTPLILFLSRPALVEILVDGRLVSSRSYGAGNNEIDTSAIGEGSFLLTLRIREDGSPVREERRFFARNARIAPLGHPIFFGVAGVLANTRPDRPVALTRELYAKAGAALRLNPAFAVDVSVLGTSHKTIGEAGAWLLTRAGRARVAGLVSSRGDVGALLQLASSGAGPFSINLDLRRVWSGDRQPLVSLSTFIDSFDAARPNAGQLVSGSYVQAIGSAGLRLGDATVSIVGAYRRDHAQGADYSIGPSVNLPVVTRNNLQLAFQASAQRTRNSMSAFAGIRMFMNRGPVGIGATLGQSVENDFHEGTRSRMIGSVDAQYSRQTVDGTLLAGQLGADRDVRSSSIRAAATYAGPMGNARVDLQQRFEDSRSTLFGITLQSGLAIAPGSSTLGARQPEQSALIIALDGDAREERFRVLVDDAERGVVKAGERLPIFVPPYRTYHVRLVPIGAPAIEVDTAVRDVTLYPGNARSLRWQVARIATYFAQAVALDGAPIAFARVSAGHDVSETDENGYFQIDVRSGDRLSIEKTGAGACTIAVGSVPGRGDLWSAGKVVCR